MAEGGFLAEAIADDRQAGPRIIQRDLADASPCCQSRRFQRLAVGAGLQSGRLTPDRQDCLAIAVVQVGADAFCDGLVRLRLDHADAAQVGRMPRVFVVIETATARERIADLDQVGAHAGLVDRRTRWQDAAIPIAEHADRTGDRNHATERSGLRRRCTIRIMQPQLPPLRIGHLLKETLRVALQADEFASGRSDLHQLAVAIEAENPAVDPGPDVLVAATALDDLQAAVRRVGARAGARVLWIAIEDDPGAIGLDDLDRPADGVQVGFVR